MGGFTCCVPGCKNNNKRDRHIRFYVFPKDPKLQEIWLKNIAKPGKSANRPFKPTHGHRVCSVHFEGGRKTYAINIPTIFNTDKPLQGKWNALPNTDISTPNIFETESNITIPGVTTSPDLEHSHIWTDDIQLLNEIKEKEKVIQDLKQRILKLENKVICIKNRTRVKLYKLETCNHSELLPA
jgi:hypothetical protein